MLVLTRRVGEEIVIGDAIRVIVVASNKGGVQLGVVAPRAVRVDRKEVAERRLQEQINREAAQKGPGAGANGKPAHES